MTNETKTENTATEISEADVAQACMALFLKTKEATYYVIDKAGKVV